MSKYRMEWVLDEYGDQVLAAIPEPPPAGMEYNRDEYGNPIFTPISDSRRIPVEPDDLDARRREILGRKRVLHPELSSDYIPEWAKSEDE